MNGFLGSGVEKGACSVGSTHRPGIALPLGTVHPSLALWKNKTESLLLLHLMSPPFPPSFHFLSVGERAGLSVSKGVACHLLTEGQTQRTVSLLTETTEAFGRPWAQALYFL